MLVNSIFFTDMFLAIKSINFYIQKNIVIIYIKLYLILNFLKYN